MQAARAPGNSTAHCARLPVPPPRNLRHDGCLPAGCHDPELASFNATDRIPRLELLR
jgi:hypothetical protein